MTIYENAVKRYRNTHYIITVSDLKKVIKTHGGKRKGAGRKPKEPTKTMRIPETLVPKVTAMIKKHKAKPFHG